VFKKNISDGVGSRNVSIHTPLDPPLFWLDNIFKYLSQGISIFHKTEEVNKNFSRDPVLLKINNLEKF
jgi:hypothetical protein